MRGKVKMKYVNLSGLLNVVIKVVTGCLKMTKVTIIAVLKAVTLLFYNFEKYGTLSLRKRGL